MAARKRHAAMRFLAENVPPSGIAERELQARAEKAGHNFHTLRDAREEVGVRPVKQRVRWGSWLLFPPLGGWPSGLGMPQAEPKPRQCDCGSDSIPYRDEDGVWCHKCGAPVGQ
jgi:hypothetical protein